MLSNDYMMSETPEGVYRGIDLYYEKHPNEDDVREND
jgi:hypothetical protein